MNLHKKVSGLCGIIIMMMFIYGYHIRTTHVKLLKIKNAIEQTNQIELTLYQLKLTHEQWLNSYCRLFITMDTFHQTSIIHPLLSKLEDISASTYGLHQSQNNFVKTVQMLHSNHHGMISAAKQVETYLLNEQRNEALDLFKNKIFPELQLSENILNHLTNMNQIKASQLAGDYSRASDRSKIFITILTVLSILTTAIAAVSLLFCHSDGLKSMTKILTDIIQRNDFSQRITTPKIKMCSDLKHCSHKECIAYNQMNACWKTVGSFSLHPVCIAIIQGKITSCEMCQVYKKNMSSETAALGTLINTVLDRFNQQFFKIKLSTRRVTSFVESIRESTTAIYNNLGIQIEDTSALACSNQEIKSNIEKLQDAVKDIQDWISRIGNEPFTSGEVNNQKNEISRLLENLISCSKEQTEAVEINESKLLHFSLSTQNALELTDQISAAAQNFQSFNQEILSAIPFTGKKQQQERIQPDKEIARNQESTGSLLVDSDGQLKMPGSPEHHQTIQINA